jgi:mono/diheme cytochrome c family protein
MTVKTLRTFFGAGIFVVFWTAFLVFIGCTTSSEKGASASPDPQSKSSGSAQAALMANDPPSSAAVVQNGKRLFTQRGCIGCHTINGSGGNVGPNLSNEANAGHSRQWLTTQIRDPKKNDPETLMPAYDTMTDKQVSDLVSYLLSLSTEHSKAIQKQPVQTAKASPSPSRAESFSMEQAGRHWSQVCGQCHNLRSPSEYSDAQWEVAVHHMRIRVPLTGQEQKEILAFLQANN